MGITTREALPEGGRGQAVHQAPQPRDLHWEDEPLKHLALKTNEPYVQESQRAVGNQDSSLKRHVHSLTCSKSQCRGSSLKSTWVIHNGDSLTNFRAHARGAGICWNILCEWKCWKYHFPLFPFYVAGSVLPLSIY